MNSMASTLPQAAPDTDADWAYCQAALREVSRTFSRPIELLPKRLAVPITCSYLLCRIADAVEDHATLAPERRSELLALLTDVLERRRAAAEFVQQLPHDPAPTADLRLAQALARVLRVFDTIDVAQRQACVPWINELALGMMVYARRPADAHGLRRLVSLADLSRYCYFVAGTVGRLLTELFLLELPELPAAQQRCLRAHAEDFGMGLQLVNILKDVSEDWERGWCFVPEAPEAAGLSAEDPTAAMRTNLKPLYDLAHRQLDAALTYALTIPATASEIRLFCLLPLWMAVRTLVLGEQLLAQAHGDRPIKITRAEVEALIADCLSRSQDDHALREGYRALWLAPATA